MTETKSYYDWELELKTKPRKSKIKENNGLGISNEDFKKFVKLWRSKNIVF
ncbi:MAG: hypothetical protein ACFE9Q_12310 [Candidatus Hodarchaeota archaeon]